MRTPAPSTSRVILVLLANAALATAIVAAGACSNPDTVDMPDCSQPGTCAVFPACLDNNGMPAPNATCCYVDGGSKSDYDVCLYGYGDPTCTVLCLDPNGNSVCSTTACPDGGVIGAPDGGKDGGKDGG
jgi:hypothetical protein